MGLLATSTFRQRLAVKLLWLMGILAVVGLSITPQAELPQVVDINDKLAHLLAYLGVTLVGVFAASSAARRHAISGFMIVLGLALEFAQLHVPGRHFEVWDMVANSAGAIIALMVFNAFSALRSKGL